MAKKISKTKGLVCVSLVFVLSRRNEKAVRDFSEVFCFLFFYFLSNEFFRFIDHSVSKQYKSSPMRYKKVYTPCEEKGDDSLRKVIFAVLQIQQCI